MLTVLSVLILVIVLLFKIDYMVALFAVYLRVNIISNAQEHVPISVN